MSDENRIANIKRLRELAQTRDDERGIFTELGSCAAGSLVDSFKMEVGAKYLARGGWIAECVEKQDYPFMPIGLTQ